MRRENIFFVVFFFLYGIVWRDRWRVEGKIAKINTNGNKEKLQIKMIMHTDGKMGRPQGNQI